MPTDIHSELGPSAGGRNGIDYRSIADQLLTDHNFISLAALAKAMGCSYWTVYGWWKNDPQFAAAFKASRQAKVDEVKESAVARATGADGMKPSDLMSIYILNNFDEEIVERLRKNANPEITIRLEVPALPASPQSWAQEVSRALPDAAVEAQYREILQVPKQAAD